MRIFQMLPGVALAASMLAVPAPAPAAGNCTTTAPTNVMLFCDDFDGTSVDAQRWQLYTNGGSASVAGGSLTLIQGVAPRFPYLYAKGTLFPASGPFTLSVGFRYLSAASNGDGFRSDQGPPANGTASGGGGSLGVWQESPGTFRVTAGCAVVQTAPPNLAAHTVTMAFAADGTRVITFDGTTYPTCGGPGARPDAFWIGNPVVAQSLQWTDISIDYVRIEMPCPENGSVSSALHGLEDEAGNAGPVVHDVSCNIVAPAGL